MNRKQRTAMKYISTLLVLLCISTLSCNREEGRMELMERSFKTYIRHNDADKDYRTKIQHVKAISLEEIGDKNSTATEEKYEGKIHFVATTSHVNSSVVYNINDTVTCYFDESIKMLRMVHPK